MMFIFSRHLSDRKLDELASHDRIPTPNEKAHLASCAGCHASLRDVRALYSAGSKVHPLDTSSMLDAIRARVEAGEQHILPQALTRSAESRSRIGRWLVAAAAALTTIWIALPTPTLVAGAVAGELRIATPSPRSGADVSVEYLAPHTLATHDSLVLRARYRTAWDEEYNWGVQGQRIGIVRRGRDGVFRGTYSLPDSVVYAALAVENMDASIVDSRGTRYWDVLAHDDSARPSMHALRQQFNDLHGRSMVAALDVGRELTRLYPTDANAWSLLSYLEQVNLGSSAARLVPEHRQRLVDLHEYWMAQPEQPFAAIAGMRSYAIQVTSTADSLSYITRHWQALRNARVNDTAGDPVVAELYWWRLNDMGSKPDSLSTALELADRFWARHGSRMRTGAMIGRQISGLSNDPTVRVKWADRYASMYTTGAEHAFEKLASFKATEREGIERLRILVTELLRADDGRRPLDMTRAQAARADSTRAGKVLGILGDALMKSGDTTAAHDAFKRAVQFGWNRVLFARTARVLLKAGDTRAAAELMARVAVDPETNSGAADSIARIGVGLVAVSRWSELTSTASQLMRETVMRDAVRERLADSVQLADENGARITLQKLAVGRVTVVAFWSAYCGPSRFQLAQLESLRMQLSKREIGLVIVGADSPSVEVKAEFRKGSVAAPLYFDIEGDATRAFRRWSTPSYYVLDAKGDLRFAHLGIGEALSRAVALTIE